MTQQQLIDFWADQINQHESKAKIMSTTFQIQQFKSLAEQARLIYMQLIQIDVNEPFIVATYVSDKDVTQTSQKNELVIPDVMPSVCVDPDHSNAVSSTGYCTICNTVAYIVKHTEA